jgi:hypothetical protein
LRAARPLFLALSAAFVACSGRTERPKPPPARAHDDVPSPRKAPPTPARHFAELSSWESMTSSPFASRGHAAGNWELDVRVSPAGRDAYRSLRPGVTMPDGSVVVALHRELDTSRAGPIYLMEKQSGRWSFQVLGPDGRPTEHGPLTLCARCHAEAAQDMLFGLPRKRD